MDKLEHESLSSAEGDLEICDFDVSCDVITGQPKESQTMNKS